jgi:GT2 family glycosyltransferase
MKLSIIIVNYNGAAFIKNCLDSVVSQFNFYSFFEIILVDNASTDASLEVLKEYHHVVRLVKNQKNVGFANAHNQLLNEVHTPYLWLLNNDTQFDGACDVITPILSYLDSHPDVVGLSPKLLNTDGSLQVQGSMFLYWVYAAKSTRQVSFLSGASLFIRTEFFKKINGFDSNLYFYNDDIDFAKQVKKHKKKLIYFPSVQITHHGGLSTKYKPIKTTVAGYYGSLYICKKYYSMPIFYMYYCVMMAIIWGKKWGHSLGRSDQSKEWVRELSALRQKIKNEL